MSTEVIMPQMGESIAEGTITKWLVAVGEAVERDQPLFEISTDKVDAEIPSPASGVLLEVKFSEGSTVQVDSVVALIGEAGEKPIAEPSAPDAGEKTKTPDSTATSDEDQAVGDAEALDLGERLKTMSSPLVRRMAAEKGVDLSRVAGTGIHGRVTKNDLLEFLESSTAMPVVKTAEVMTTPAKSQPGEFIVPAFTEGENVEIQPMSNIRKLTAAHMAYSKRTSAHVTTVFHMDMSRVAKVRKRAKDGFLRTHGTKLTYMPFIFKAVANGLIANPKINASIDGTNIVFKKDINIGIAVALDWGLLVPVIRHADRLNLVGLAQTANDLADRARRKKLSPDEIQRGTFTITNPGVFGSLFGMPIINQPQVAIMGIGTIEKRPIVETDEDGNDTIAIKYMSYFAITYDHRLVDGADADHFMNDVKKTLLEESWSELDPFL